jgi:hypothetical protein
MECVVGEGVTGQGNDRFRPIRVFSNSRDDTIGDVTTEEIRSGLVVTGNIKVPRPIVTLTYTRVYGTVTERFKNTFKVIRAYRLSDESEIWMITEMRVNSFLDIPTQIVSERWT